MFGILFKQKNSTKKHNSIIAKDLYRCALENTRQEVFYTRYGIPDTFDGRFDLLLLHIFMILNRIMEHNGDDTLSQALFDATFRDMDQTLREMGIGDVGIPKHMKKMMKAFNGRMYNYQMAVAPDFLDGAEVEGLVEASLEEVVARNIYGVEDSNSAEYGAYICKTCNFIRYNLNDNDLMNVKQLMNGKAHFVNDVPLKYR